MILFELHESRRLSTSQSSSRKQMFQWTWNNICDQGSKQEKSLRPLRSALVLRKDGSIWTEKRCETKKSLRKKIPQAREETWVDLSVIPIIFNNLSRVEKNSIVKEEERQDDELESNVL